MAQISHAMMIVLRNKDGLEIDRRKVFEGQRSSQALREWLTDNPDLFEGDRFVMEVAE